MDIFLIILAGLFLLIGLFGSVLPVLPGVPLSYVGILLLHFTDRVQFSTNFLIFWAVMVFIVQLLDYISPILMTKKFGGSRRAVWGSTLGLIVGCFFGPWGIVLGPFAGAFIAELTSNKNGREALRAAFGSFVGFLVGSVSKLIVAGFLIYYYVEALLF